MGSETNNKRAPNIKTSYPGHIYNFDPATQTCEVQLALENLFIGLNKAFTLTPSQRLSDVPVKFVQGGGWSLTHPIPDGTPCYVHFAQRGISHWIAENKSEAGFIDGKPAPSFGQLFSYNSAVCTVGYQPMPKVIPEFNNEVFELRNADRNQRVTLNPDGLIEIVSGETYINIKGDEVFIHANKTTVESSQILLDGDTTITKSLTVMGGASISGGNGQTVSVTGNVKHNGSYSLNGIKVDGHNHIGDDGGNTGPMK